MAAFLMAKLSIKSSEASQSFVIKDIRAPGVSSGGGSRSEGRDRGGRGGRSSFARDRRERDYSPAGRKETGALSSVGRAAVS